MPIYEFRCQRCRQRVEVFQRSISAAVEATCPHCGSGDLHRLVSRFAVVRSLDDLFDEPFDDAMLDEMADLSEADPAQVAAWARKMKDRLGEDLGPEFDEMVARLEAGESLDDETLADEEGSEETDTFE